MASERLTGLVAAVFTPMYEDGRLNLDQVGGVVDHLIRNNLSGIYVCGTTGEGPSLSSEERRAVAGAYVQAAAGRLPVIVHVGHNSLTEAGNLAEHAQEIGAAGIAAVPPSYFRIGSVDVLVQCLTEIAGRAPQLPLYYYHIPALTELDVDVVELLDKASERIPSFAGMKYTASTIDKYQACVDHARDRFTVLFGYDEMLLSALAVGARGAVGTTYNFAAPLYQRIGAAFERGDLDEARQLQGLSVKMVQVFNRYRGQPGFKAGMRLIGLDCGPVRWPQVALTAQEYAALETELREIGFFEWAVG